MKNGQSHALSLVSGGLSFFFSPLITFLSTFRHIPEGRSQRIFQGISPNPDSSRLELKLVQKYGMIGSS